MKERSFSKPTIVPSSVIYKIIYKASFYLHFNFIYAAHSLLTECLCFYHKISKIPFHWKFFMLLHVQFFLLELPADVELKFICFSTSLCISFSFSASSSISRTRALIASSSCNSIKVLNVGRERQQQLPGGRHKNPKVCF